MNLLNENEKLRDGKNLEQYQGIIEENASLKDKLADVEARGNQ